MTNVWTSFLGSGPAVLGDAADNRAAAQDAGGTGAAAACTAEGADTSTSALCGKVGGEVVGVVWDAASGLFGGSTYDCSYFSANWPDVPLDQATEDALPAYLRAAVKAAADTWAVQNYQTWSDQFQQTVNKCFPVLGSMYEGVRVQFFHLALAENNARIATWNQTHPDAAALGLINPFSVDDVGKALAHNKAQLGYGPGDSCTTPGGASGVVDDNSVCVASDSGSNGSSPTNTASTSSTSGSSGKKILIAGAVVAAGVVVWKYRDKIATMVHVLAPPAADEHPHAPFASAMALKSAPSASNSATACRRSNAFAASCVAIPPAFSAASRSPRT